MWSDEQLSDAVGVLLKSGETSGVQKVEDLIEDGSRETYLVVGDVTYTDPLYVKALEKLVQDGCFKEIENQEGRSLYRKA